MIRSYRFRLWTTANQERELARTLESHRRIYNATLDGRMLCWEAAGHNWTYAEQCRWLLRARRNNEHWSLLPASSCVQTVRRQDKAFKAFFSRVRKGGKPGFPRFQGVDRFNSFVLATSHGYCDGWKLIDGKLRVKNTGTIRVRWHRQLPAGKLKSLRIVHDNGKWFALFCVEAIDPHTTTNVRYVGVDVGLNSFATTSDGESIGDSRSLEAVLPELRRRQRALARCKRGSNRRQAVKTSVRTLHARVANVRKDMHHKVAKSLVDRYGVIAAESLSIGNMLKNRRLARRISDAGWYSFVQILIGKAESAGCKVVLVDPRNTSQACSACGEIVRKSLAVRVHKCECGCVLDRDVNAAINILGRAVPEGAKAGLLALS